jgi:pimeloyl-ACP methyl ester carboxylesterase
MTSRARSTRSRLHTFRRDDLLFDVIDEGPANGEAVVLLHGFPGGAATWDAVAPRLAEAGCRTLVLDQRGYSPQARPPDVDAYRVGELVADVLGLADRAGLDRFHVIGHDWGGIVAWHLAGAHPERLRTLTVLSTPHPRAMAQSMTRSLQGLRSAYALAWQIPELPERFLLAGGGRLLRSALLRSGLDSGHGDAYVDRMRRPGALTAALNWYRAAGRAARVTATVPDIRVPTLYVWSTNDPALGRTAAELTARRVEGRYDFVVLDGVSHWIPETVPDQVVELVLTHMQRDPASRSTWSRNRPGSS